MKSKFIKYHYRHQKMTSSPFNLTCSQSGYGGSGSSLYIQKQEGLSCWDPVGRRQCYVKGAGRVVSRYWILATQSTGSLHLRKLDSLVDPQLLHFKNENPVPNTSFYKNGMGQSRRFIPTFFKVVLTQWPAYLFTCLANICGNEISVELIS